MKNEKPVVYLNEPLHPDVVARLAEKCELVSSYDHPERLDAVIVRQQYCRRDVIANAPRLKLISVHGTGTDRIDCDAADEYGVPIVIHKGYNSRSVAELAVA
ncbi:MAG: 3-phosphoglycerate dehydrogenase, partial [Oscillospiraceae bacterium]|nr:3-phosphoglycerate dehydrogenase [Oscillospiraceae bacterium]